MTNKSEDLIKNIDDLTEGVFGNFAKSTGKTIFRGAKAVGSTVAHGTIKTAGHVAAELGHAALSGTASALGLGGIDKHFDISKKIVGGVSSGIHNQYDKKFGDQAKFKTHSFNSAVHAFAASKGISDVKHTAFGTVHVNLKGNPNLHNEFKQHLQKLGFNTHSYQQSGNSVFTHRH